MCNELNINPLATNNILAYFSGIIIVCTVSYPLLIYLLYFFEFFVIDALYER